MKIKIILLASLLFLVSVQVNAASLDTVLTNGSEVTALSELSPIPMSSAFWLFGAALIGFVGMSRRTNVN